MPIIEITNEDVLRGKLVTPGWYKVKIGEFSEEMTKDGKSTNYVFKDCIIICNADTGDEEFAGVPIKILFSAKPTAKGFMLGFIAALGGNVTPGSRFNIADASGKVVEAMVENNLYNDNISNRINHKYRVAK